MGGGDDSTPPTAASGDEPRTLPGNITDPVDPAAWLELNRAWWDDRIGAHQTSAFYDEAGFRAGRHSLQPWEPPLLGDVTGLRLIHLQCHMGHDTMTWARLGASVVGLDFSAPAVDIANGLATDLDLDARFVCADVYGAEAALDGERFDVVYTGFGAINWLPDIDRWARVVASLLAPGGRLLLSEFHPITWAFGDDFTIEYDYFEAEPFAWEDAGSYVDEHVETTDNRTIEQQHTLAAIVAALLAAGLRVERFDEYPETLFPRWPFLERGDDGVYRWPEGHPRIPLMFSLLASRAAAGTDGPET